MICLYIYITETGVINKYVCKTVKTSRKKTTPGHILTRVSEEFTSNVPAEIFFQMAEIMPADDGGNTCSGCCDVGGYRHPVFDKTPSQIKKIFENMPNFPLRDDDYLLCSFPKTGNVFVVFFFSKLSRFLHKISHKPHIHL